MRPSRLRFLVGREAIESHVREASCLRHVLKYAHPVKQGPMEPGEARR